jgi:hypothetical protein
MSDSGCRIRGTGGQVIFIDQKEAGEEREWCEEWLPRGGNRRKVARGHDGPRWRDFPPCTLQEATKLDLSKLHAGSGSPCSRCLAAWVLGGLARNRLRGSILPGFSPRGATRPGTRIGVEGLPSGR